MRACTANQPVGSRHGPRPRTDTRTRLKQEHRHQARARSPSRDRAGPPDGSRRAPRRDPRSLQALENIGHWQRGLAPGCGDQLLLEVFAMVSNPQHQLAVPARNEYALDQLPPCRIVTPSTGPKRSARNWRICSTLGIIDNEYARTEVVERLNCRRPM